MNPGPVFPTPLPPLPTYVTNVLPVPVPLVSPRIQGTIALSVGGLVYVVVFAPARLLVMKLASLVASAIFTYDTPVAGVANEPVCPMLLPRSSSIVLPPVPRDKFAMLACVFLPAVPEEVMPIVADLLPSVTAPITSLTEPVTDAP